MELYSNSLKLYLINIMLDIFASILLTLIFFITGINKAMDYAGTVNTIESKFNFLNSDIMYNIITVLVILLELLAPIVIVYSAITGQLSYWAFISIIMLVVFTLVATGLFYFPPSKENKLMIMIHLGLVGGLLALLSLNVQLRQ